MEAANIMEGEKKAIYQLIIQHAVRKEVKMSVKTDVRQLWFLPYAADEQKAELCAINDYLYNK